MSALEFVLWLAAAVAAGVAAGLLLVSGLRALARRWNVTVLTGRLWQSPVVTLLVLVAARVVVDAAAYAWSEAVSYALWIGQVASLAWLGIVLVRTAEKAALAKHPDTGLTAAASRHVRTKISLLRRVAVSLIIAVAVGAVLFSIPEVRTVGVTLLASAGVLGIVAGLAAQTSLANIFAGIQIAFTDAIRVGDIVQFDDLTGRIEEITLTYVVVEVWDGTSLILPCTFFNTTPFRNWTHSGASITGQVDLAVSWAVPLQALRDELDRVLQASDLWDGARGDLRVQDASGPVLRVTAFVSARDADALEPLRWAVREALVELVQREHPGALPRELLELAPGADARDATGA